MYLSSGSSAPLKEKRGGWNCYHLCKTKSSFLSSSVYSTCFYRARHSLGPGDNKVAGKTPTPGSTQTGEGDQMKTLGRWGVVGPEPALAHEPTPPLQGSPLATTFWHPVIFASPAWQLRSVGGISFSILFLCSS